MKIVKQNPFRILGLPINASEREIQKQVNILKRFSEIGKEIKTDFDFNYIGNISRKSEEISKSVNRIEVSDDKIIVSLFWFIKVNNYDKIALTHLRENNIEKAFDIWKKTLRNQVTQSNYSSYHNLSILYLFLYLERTNGSNYIEKCIKFKYDLFNSTSFFLLCSQVNGNNYKPILLDIIARFINVLYTNIDKKKFSQKDFLSLFNEFDCKTKQYIENFFTKNSILRIENRINKTTNLRKDDPQEASIFGKELYKETISDLKIIKDIYGIENIQYLIVADKLSNELLQCAIDFHNINTNNNEFDPIDDSLIIVDYAKSIETSDQVKERIEENHKIFINNKFFDCFDSIYLINDIIARINEIGKGNIDQKKIDEIIFGFLTNKIILKISKSERNDLINNFYSALISLNNLLNNSNYLKTILSSFTASLPDDNQCKIDYMLKYKPKKITKHNQSVVKNRNNNEETNSRNVIFFFAIIICLIFIYLIKFKDAEITENYPSLRLNAFSNDSPTKNKKQIYQTTENSLFAGNQLINGESPYNSFFGNGIYNKNHLNKILFKNGYDSDAIVCLVDYYSEKTIRNEYIRAGTNFEMTNIPNGKYYIKTISGKDWNPHKKVMNNQATGCFDTKLSFSQSKNINDLIPMNDNGYQYSTAEITLYQVANGNMKQEIISEKDFFE